VVLLAGWIFVRWWNRDVISIKTATVARGPIEQVVTASGIVDAPVYELGPKMGGKIMKINVKEGERVTEGETLAEFDDTTRLVAPASGIVAKVNYDVGEMVSPGMPAIVVVNYSKSWVNAQIDEIDIANVKIGDKVKITSDVYPDKVYDGQIYWIAPLAELRKVGGRVKMDEESYVFPCKIRLLESHDELKVNMSVNVDIATKKNNRALIVPREALVSKDDSSLVFKVMKNRVSESRITIGIRSYNSVEATAGVSEGDIVAVTNVSKLKDKGRVKIER
jgi:RND family efflux transporter MFP subunit